MEERLILAWLKCQPIDGDGSGDGSGSGSGDGYGDGDGPCYGDGYGSGDGSGDGYGDGSGYGYDEGYGDGSGYGDGYGYDEGDGDGYGYGYGDGDGSGYGDGYGSGDGSGDGSGLKSYNHRRVFYIDDQPTLIDAIIGDYATGAIVRDDLTLRQCYVARCHGYFAHGDTLRQAQADAESKWMEERPLGERLDEFVKAHPDLDTPYDDLFAWHHTLTGSCTAGRENWCEEHGLKPTDAITVRYFIENTRNDYGGDAIRQLAERYGITLKS